jgi:glycosyltransferase involved in cell wall biosynthesis
VTPRVSALIVTYGHERFIEEAVRSALAQGEVDVEVVVVDDGSRDLTRERVASVTDRRVRLIAEPHRGIERLADTYNAGLAHCRGEFVALLEGDDRWPERKLSSQLTDLADSAVVCAHGEYAVIGARGTMLRPRVPSPVPIRAGAYDALPHHLLMSYIMPVTAVVRRSTLEEIGGFRQLGRTPHWDWPTFLALAERGQFAYRSEVVGHWRKHASSGTMRLTGRDLEGVELSLRIALATLERLPRRPDLPDASAIRRAWSDAFARQVWHIGRVLLVARDHARAREFAYSALARGCSLSLRARLLLIVLAAVARVDLEGSLRLLRRRSTLEELS